MAYNKEKDLVLGEWWLEADWTDLRIAVHSYNGGEPRVSITRFKVSKPNGNGNVERKWEPLRRLSDYEWKWILQHAEPIRQAIIESQPVIPEVEHERPAVRV